MTTPKRDTRPPPRGVASESPADPLSCPSCHHQLWWESFEDAVVRCAICEVPDIADVRLWIKPDRTHEPGY